jgi:phosphate transport system protein
MTRNAFHQQIEELQLEILRMAGLIQVQLDDAVRALMSADEAAARRVLAGDDEVDRLHMDVEGKALKLLALQQPVGLDLRIIGSGMKMVTDLERIGDHAVDIARLSLRLREAGGGAPPEQAVADLPKMAALARQMIELALKAYVERNAELARQMINLDHEVDHLYNNLFKVLLQEMSSRPGQVKAGTYFLHAAMYLERVADHATNLGEWVIYMATGDLKELND